MAGKYKISHDICFNEIFFILWELHHVFQICSLEFSYAVIDVLHPTVATKKSFKIKIIAVKNAYSSLRQILIDFNIPCVKKAFGPAIVRVSCRSVS